VKNSTEFTSPMHSHFQVLGAQALLVACCFFSRPLSAQTVMLNPAIPIVDAGADSSPDVNALRQANSSESETFALAIDDFARLPRPIHGITLADDRDIRDAKYLSQVIPSLTNLSVTPTVRVVFTLELVNGRQGASANSYHSAVRQIKTTTTVNTNSHPFVLGLPVDSSAMFCFTREAHAARWNDYVKSLSADVDVWEVGNEINGNWLYNSGKNADVSEQSCPNGWPGGVPTTTVQDVADKMVDAFNMVKAAGKPAALTLTFCPTDLPAANDPFTWVDTYVTRSAVRKGMDYVLISYYSDEVSCKYGFPKESDWVSWFKGIESRFPNARVGLGEWGYGTKQPPNNLKTLLEKGYGLNPSASLDNPSKWIGGVFYWEFGATAVPYTGENQLGSPSDWSDVDTNLQNQH
jgi:hypothetical protein